jgi:hypothetical protein
VLKQALAGEQTVRLPGSGAGPGTG